MAVELSPRGPFALAQSIEFAAGFDPMSSGGADGRFFASLCDDDGTSAAFVAHEVDGRVVIEHDGALSDDRLCAHAARILSLDTDASALADVAARDQVAAAVLAEFPGARPVCFPTPFEVAAWSVLSQRTSMRQAAVVKAGLSQALGEEVEVGGRRDIAFPSPMAVAEAPELPGVGGAQRLERLRAVARAAADGALDPELLRGFATPDEALAHLEGIHGIGPFSALLVLTRGAGHPDVAPPTTIARARQALAEPYGLDPDQVDAECAASLADAWRPFRSWIFFLLRNRPAG